MEEENINNKRIAKNTLLLYGRMLFTMWISLYTSRMTLDILGVVDFGIYNVVGGVIALMWALNGALSTSTTRHITFELGTGNISRLSLVFKTSLTIHTLIGALIIIICETIGLWFMCAQLVIPAERMEAAQWVYQFSLLSMVLNVLSVPFNACIIAHEKMQAYAYISIIDTILKLVIAFALKWTPFDKLILYSFLYFLTQLIIQALYMFYCKNRFHEVQFSFVWNKPLLKTMVSFTGWNLIGSGSALLMSQGHSIILNQFFGPVINAAKGIANQVQGIVVKFSGNFQMALNPQIFKSYAAENLEYMHKLIFASSKYSYFMIFVLALPISVESENLLGLWLKIVPENTNGFLRLILLTSAVNALANPLVIGAQATGKIKIFQSTEAFVLLLILPFTYFSALWGASPIIAFYIYLIFHIIAVIARLIILHVLIHISYRNYITKVAIPILVVSFFSIITSIFLHLSINNGTFISSLFVCILTFLSITCYIYIFGLNQGEKAFVRSKSKDILHKINTRS